MTRLGGKVHTPSLLPFDTSFSKIRYVWKGRKTGVRFIIQTHRVERADMRTTRQSHTSTSWCVPRISRFGELLMEFTPQPTESNPLPSSKPFEPFDLNLFTDYVRDPTGICLDKRRQCCADTMFLPRCIAVYYLDTVSIDFFLVSSDIFITSRHVVFTCIA